MEEESKILAQAPKWSIRLKPVTDSILVEVHQIELSFDEVGELIHELQDACFEYRWQKKGIL